MQDGFNDTTDTLYNHATPTHKDSTMRTHYSPESSYDNVDAIGRLIDLDEEDNKILADIDVMRDDIKDLESRLSQEEYEMDYRRQEILGIDDEIQKMLAQLPSGDD